MQYLSRRFSSLLAFAGIALLLMGAENQVISTGTGSVMSNVASSVTSTGTGSVMSSVTSSITGSLISGMTNSPLSRVTGSITSRTTHSLSSSMTRSAAAGVVSRATITKVTLSPAAEELAKSIKFDRQVLLMAKEESQDHIGRLIGSDEEGFQIIAPGIVISVPEARTDHILSSLRQKLFAHKYMAFVVEMNAGLKTDKIGILKGTDQYEILRIMHTDGNDYDISNQDVIDRLKEWEINSPFVILGADSDWVEIEFRILPKDLHAFVEEVRDFCPDAVDQGQGSIAELVKEIQKTRKLFLWWD
jgi:hypothetical protein